MVVVVVVVEEDEVKEEEVKEEEEEEEEVHLVSKSQSLATLYAVQIMKINLSRCL